MIMLMHCDTLKEHECQQKQKHFIAPILEVLPDGYADVFNVI